MAVTFIVHSNLNLEMAGTLQHYSKVRASTMLPIVAWHITWPSVIATSSQALNAATVTNVIDQLRTGKVMATLECQAAAPMTASVGTY